MKSVAIRVSCFVVALCFVLIRAARKSVPRRVGPAIHASG